MQREFDTNGRLASLDDGAAGDYEFTYDVEGVLASVTYRNGVVTSVTRDNLANTTNAQTVSGSSVLFDAAYSYGDDGLPSEVLESGNAELDQQFAYEDR